MAVKRVVDFVVVLWSFLSNAKWMVLSVPPAAASSMLIRETFTTYRIDSHAAPFSGDLLPLSNLSVATNASIYAFSRCL